MKYFINIVEEFWPGQREDTWIGRVEYIEESKYGDYLEEINFSTFDRDGAEKLIQKYDFRTISKREFTKLKQKVAELNQVKK